MFCSNKKNGVVILSMLSLLMSFGLGDSANAQGSADRAQAQQLLAKKRTNSPAKQQQAYFMAQSIMMAKYYMVQRAKYGDQMPATQAPLKLPKRKK